MIENRVYCKGWSIVYQCSSHDFLMGKTLLMIKLQQYYVVNKAKSRVKGYGITTP